ncbi:MAG: rhomboid family intramembrane serine protease [Bacteroidales bacterium]|nr:rhomboid family intramembrane serine protease [Bacteroidales bacterium]
MNYFKYQLQNSPVVKNLLFINILIFLAEVLLGDKGLDITDFGAVYYPDSSKFMPFQVITSPFLHGSFSHLFYNMFALFMFGCIIEQVMDSKKFLIYYIGCALGATLFTWGVDAIMIQTLDLMPGAVEEIKIHGADILQQGYNFSDPNLARLNIIYNVGTIGASGAIFGILLAFGMIFPNRPIYLYFVMPIKAKWIVIIYGGFELLSGITQNMYDNVAHFAHVGGMIVGIIILLYWKKNGTINFYKY